MTSQGFSWGLVRSLLITGPIIILATIVMGTLNLLVSLFETSGRRQVAIARLWSKMLIWIAGVKLTLEGAEHVDLTLPYVFACNHLSYMDTPVLLGHLPVEFRFLAKEMLFRVRFSASISPAPATSPFLAKTPAAPCAPWARPSSWSKTAACRSSSFPKAAAR